MPRKGFGRSLFIHYLPSVYRVTREARRSYYHQGYHNGYHNGYNNGHYYHHYEPCGPFRRRACYPGLRAAKVVGTAAFGGALIGAGIANG